MPQDSNNIAYIGTTDYKKLETKIKQLVTTMDDLQSKNEQARRLRYVEVDIESERATGKLQADELYIPQHIIDTNIRREQSSYIQYLSQSARALILNDIEEPSADCSIIERDVTNRIRFEGWQLSKFATVDGMQQNGYGVLEVVLDQSQPGELAHEAVQLGDFGMVSDTKDVQEAEMLARNYYFSKTRLLAMCDDNSYGFSREQVDILIGTEPQSDDSISTSRKDKSLYRIQKIMFRVKGVVQVGWACEKVCSDWLRAPRPLYIGRRKLKEQPSIMETIKSSLTGLPVSEAVFETKYPYIIYPYVISENNTISQLKGRAYLDQDTQQAAASLISSYCTAHRRAAGLYFSKDVSDPNDDLLLQKNVYFEQGCLINSKISSFQLQAPSAELVGAVNLIVSANQQETAKVNFAAQNRKDSRKTATEIQASTQEAAQLSTVQVVLFSNSERQIGQLMFEIIRSRVMAGLIKVSPVLQQLYARKYKVKPAGDVDVIERQQMVQAMMSAWEVMQNTPAATAFLSDLLTKMFPDSAPRYIQIFAQAEQAKQTAQAQQTQQLLAGAMQMGKGIVHLADHKEYFSDVGKLHALPAVEQAAEQIKTLTANTPTQ